MRVWTSLLMILTLSASVHAQDDMAIEAELNAVQGPADSPAPKNSVDEEEKKQSQVWKRKQSDEKEIGTDRNVNRFPKTESLFRKPPGPKEGGTVLMEHPKAAEGLLRINKDGSYQYRTQTIEKSKSSAVKIGLMTPPKIGDDGTGVDFETMYGTDDLVAVNFEYEWQPVRQYGFLGLKGGLGFSTVTASGYFRNQTDYRTSTRSEESYSLFIVPISAFLEYRFEYFRRQWLVPFINGGATFYGLMELRNDGASPQFAGAPAAGGGGGFLVSLSRMDLSSAFTLSEEYGIADMWLVLEARAMQGLSEEIDFTNQTVSAGIQVDF